MRYILKHNAWSLIPVNVVYNAQLVIVFNFNNHYNLACGSAFLGQSINIYLHISTILLMCNYHKSVKTPYT